MSSQITFRRVGADEARIYDADGDHVGDLFRHPDILNAGRHVFILHLDGLCCKVRLFGDVSA